jgi:hypothetical protein
MEGSPRRLSSEKHLNTNARRHSVSHMLRKMVSKFSSSEESPPPSPGITEAAANELKELTGRPAHTPITPS